MTPGDLVRAVHAAGVNDSRILDAIRATPRAEFVPADQVELAYRDKPLPIAHGQVTTQPSLSALMIEALDLTESERVLEIGPGLGFQTALLARLAANVVSVELWPDLAEQAGQNLARQNIANVTLRVGDGSCGHPRNAPYDAILVSAAFPTVPPPLVEQLRLGGRLVQPVGPGGHEEVMLFLRTADGLEQLRVVTLASFVRLHGQYGYPI